MECNRLKESDHEGRQGLRDAVRSNRPSKKGRKDEKTRVEKIYYMSEDGWFGFA